MNLQMRDISEAVINSMTEAEYVEWRKKANTKLVYHQNRYWEELRSGFYQPVHLLARLSERQATRPKLSCWGFRSALARNDLAAANGSIPVHLLTNISDYNLQSLPSKRRNHVRRCRKRAKIMELTDSTILKKYGYEVVVSALKRAKYKNPPQKDKYIESLTNYVSPCRRLILAGIVEDKLGGYMECHAIDGTAYIQNVYIASEALPSNIGTGLVFDFVQICIRSGGINEIVYGQHSREDERLCIFKQGMGFPAVHVPAKVQINSIIGKFIQWRSPHSYYRLTGH